MYADTITQSERNQFVQTTCDISSFIPRRTFTFTVLIRDRLDKVSVNGERLHWNRVGPFDRVKGDWEREILRSRGFTRELTHIWMVPNRRGSHW